MKLAIITSSFPRAPEDSRNAGVFVRDVARQLAGEGHDVTVITPMRTEADREPYRIVSFWSPARETSLSHIGPLSPRGLWTLATVVVSGLFTTIRVLRRERPDRVVAMWAIPSGLLALAARRLLGIRYAVWALGSDIWKIDSYPSGRSVLRRVLAGADVLYADGRQLADEVAAIAGRPCAFLPSSRTLPVQPATGQPDLDPSMTHFLTVARFHPHKGVDVLLEALALVDPAPGSRMNVHLFGEGPEGHRLEAQIRDLGLGDRVQMHGPLSPTELAGWLRAADALVIPSRIESVPLILLDAAQQHCPVIATTVGDVGGIVAAYRLGRTVPPEDPPALAAALSRAVDTPLPYDAALADQLVSEFSISRSCRTLTESLTDGERHREGEPSFDHRDYWEQRLGDDFSLQAVGVKRCGLEFNRWAYRRRGERFTEVVQRFVPEPTAARVLDIGSGTGFYIESWAQLGAAEIHGCDIADLAVERLRERFPAATFHQLDISRPLPPQLAGVTFDVVDAMDVLWHVTDEDQYQRALTNIANLLVPGGLFIWTDNFVHRPRPGRAHIAFRTLDRANSALEQSGFRVLAREPFLVLMNAPEDSRIPLAGPVWRAVVGAACLTEAGGGLMGRTLYRLDRRLATTLRESPSVEIMVCQRV